MGTIPILQRNTPGYMPTVRQDASAATPDAFGAALGRGMQSFGGAVTSLGEMGMRYNEKKNAEAEAQRKEDERAQREADSEAAKNALLIASAKADSTVAEFRTNAMGANARQSQPDVQRKIDDVLESSIQGLSERQRDLLIPKLEAERIRYATSLQVHADNQWSSHLDKQDDALADEGEKIAGEMYFDNWVVKQGEDKTAAAIKSKGLRKGWSLKQINVEIAARRGKILSGVFDLRFGGGDIEGARSLVAERGEEMGVGSRSAAEKVLERYDRDSAKREQADQADLHRANISRIFATPEMFSPANQRQTYQAVLDAREEGALSHEQAQDLFNKIPTIVFQASNDSGRNIVNNIKRDLALTANPTDDDYKKARDSVAFVLLGGVESSTLSQQDATSAISFIDEMNQKAGKTIDPLYGTENGKHSLRMLKEAEDSSVFGLGNRIVKKRKVGKEDKLVDATQETADQFAVDNQAKDGGMFGSKFDWPGGGGDAKAAEDHNRKVSMAVSAWQSKLDESKQAVYRDVTDWLRQNPSASREKVAEYINNRVAPLRLQATSRAVLDGYAKPSMAPAKGGK